MKYLRLSNHILLISLTLFVVLAPVCVRYITCGLGNRIPISDNHSADEQLANVPHARIRMSEDNYTPYYVNKRTDASEGQEKHREQVIRDPVVKGSSNRELTGDYTSETPAPPKKQTLDWDYAKKTPYIGYTILRDEDWLSDIFPKSSQPLDQPR